MKFGAQIAVLMLALLTALTGCRLGDQRDPQLPDPAEAAARYGSGAEAEIRGNVLEVRVEMPQAVVRQGGVIWARSGPYFYLFSPPTRELFTEYPDLAAVRVVTSTSEGEEIARATLLRDALSEIRWRQGLALSARAQQQGTERPRMLEELTYFGEEWTEFQYNPEYVDR